MRRFLACLMLAISVGTAQACLCRDIPSVEALRLRSSDVFVGRVLSLTASGVGYRGQVFIERSWKGAQAGSTVVVATVGVSTMCGVEFRPGYRLLVFANPDQKGVFWAWRCNRSTSAPANIAALSDSLGEPSSTAKYAPSSR